MRCPDCSLGNLQGLVEFTVNGTTISNYIWNWPDRLCGNNNCNVFVDPCPQIEQGEGIIVDEVTLEIAVTRIDCVSECVGTQFYVREG